MIVWLCDCDDCDDWWWLMMIDDDWWYDWKYDWKYDWTLCLMFMYSGIYPAEYFGGIQVWYKYCQGIPTGKTGKKIPWDSNVTIHLVQQNMPSIAAYLNFLKDSTLTCLHCK